ncbi:MAG: hypothetical protein ACK57S_02245 [Brevundimonas sp.]|uniref:hypothetical protein n=1 Tax=Brevundimonas sp. TaxID=1871086 RepID=UPI00391F8B06
MTAAKAVVRDGAPELVAAVETGEVAVTAAAEVAKLPEEVQAQVIAEGPHVTRHAPSRVSPGGVTHSHRGG